MIINILKTPSGDKFKEKVNELTKPISNIGNVGVGRLMTKAPIAEVKITPTPTPTPTHITPPNQVEVTGVNIETILKDIRSSGDTDNGTSVGLMGSSQLVSTPNLGKK